jgi:hypothetical protein
LTFSGIATVSVVEVALRPAPGRARPTGGASKATGPRGERRPSRRRGRDELAKSRRVRKAGMG